MKSVKDVDEYIVNAPKKWQVKLKELRELIKTAAPDSQESISYGMPTYHYKERLVYFQLWKKHIGMYGINRSVIDKFKSELEGNVMPKGTIQLPLDQELPIALIKKLIKAQVRANIDAEKKK